MQIAECQTIEDLVIKKLAKNKPYIKYKALRIVKFLCENGSPNWRRAWQRNTDKLRDAQQFRGPPDPIYGDAPYQQVRKAAKDAMQAVFQQHSLDSSHIKQRIKSIDGTSAWSSSSGTTGASSFGSGSKGTYGGSSVHKDAPTAPSWDKKPMPGHGNTSYQPQARKTTFEPLKSSGVYSNPSVLSQGTAHSRGKLDTRKTGKRKKGKAGGVWGGEEEEEDDDEEEEDEQAYEEEYPSYRKPQKKTFGGNIKKSKPSSGQYEKRWVDDIVKSGGVGCKILDLPKYVTQFENLSKSHVLEYLDEKLEDSAWQKQGKALALIEALLKGKSSDDVVDYFSQSPENVTNLTNHKKSAVRRKASAILEYLDVDENDDEPEEETEDESPAVPQGRNQPPAQSDLINMGGGDDAGDEEDDMFANMEQVDEPTNHNINADDMFSGMNAVQTQPQTVSANTGDIMDIMGDVDDTQTNMQKAEEQKRSKEKYNFLDDLANETGVSQTSNAAADDGGILGIGFGAKTSAPASATQQAPSQSTSAFGFELTASGGGGAAANASAATQQSSSGGGSGGSAFGFDLGGASGNQTQSQPAQTKTSMNAAASTMTASSGGPSAFGFDLGGSGGNKASQGQTSMNTMGGMSGMNAMAQSNMMGGMNQMNPNMMTQQMMMQNQQNMTQMHQMMNQMAQMGMNPNMMNMMNQMNPNMMMQAQQPNQSFIQAMQNVNNPASQQRPQAAYVGHSDPFAQVMAGGASQSAAPQRAQKTGPDPFAEFGLGHFG